MIVQAFRLLKLSFAILLLLISTESYAVKNYFHISDEEMKRLPPFCKYGYERYNIEQKVAIFLNHLCPGLNALNHAKKIVSNGIEKKYALQRAAAHFTYTLDHAKKFPFRSTVYVKRGTVYEMQGNIQKATQDYQEALKIDPKNVFAYSALAQIFEKLKNKTEATKIVNQGLKIRPNSRVLLRMKRKLEE